MGDANMKKKLENIKQVVLGTYHDMDTSGCSSNCREDFIRKRAYELYVERGNAPGRPLDDWLQAEREINHHLGS